MERIASFSINHDTLQKGMYISRIDGDVVTYDIRMKRPNQGDYLPNPVLHTFEHLFATYARNSAFADAVIYVGPMGCVIRSPMPTPSAWCRSALPSSPPMRARFPEPSVRSAATISSTTWTVRKQQPRTCARFFAAGHRTI